MKFMNTALDIRELSIVVIAKNNNPTILNPDFLKDNNVVPAEWELGNPPICIEPMAEVSFKNKIKITAQLDKVIFFEDTGDKKADEFMVPTIAQKYTETLPHVEYIAVGINPRGHIVLEGNEEAPRKYMLDNLITPGPWRDFGNKPVKTAIKFEYALEKAICNLTIEEKHLQGPETKAMPVLVFASNFHHELSGETRQECLQGLHRILTDWETDLRLYKHLVNDVFLSGGA